MPQLLERLPQHLILCHSFFRQWLVILGTGKRGKLVGGCGWRNLYQFWYSELGIFFRLLSTSQCATPWYISRFAQISTDQLRAKSLALPHLKSRRDAELHHILSKLDPIDKQTRVDIVKGFIERGGVNNNASLKACSGLISFGMRIMVEDPILRASIGGGQVKDQFQAETRLLISGPVPWLGDGYLCKNKAKEMTQENGEWVFEMNMPFPKGKQGYECQIVQFFTSLPQYDGIMNTHERSVKFTIDPNVEKVRGHICSLPSEEQGVDQDEFLAFSSGLRRLLPAMELPELMKKRLFRDKRVALVKSFVEKYLDSTGLGGELPPALSSLQRLQTLNMFDSNFNGSIPDFLANMSSLEVLAMYGNKRSGPLAASLANLTNLRELTLRNCQLSGFIPDLGNLTQLTHLHLSFNNLTGTIPAYISSFDRLSRLFLGSNNLTGGLPNQLSRIVDLNATIIGNPFSATRTQGYGSLRVQQDAINCGGPQIISDGTDFNIDMPSSFTIPQEDGYLAALMVPLVSRLYYIKLPTSLRCLGVGMRSGSYTVHLHFAEITIGTGQDGPGVGIQGDRKLKDFNIREEANGSLRALRRSFTAVNVSNGVPDIHLLWMGKGTCCAPFRSFGPLISAIQVLPELKLLDGKLHMFSYDEIENATGGFDPVRLLGKGVFGKVYKVKFSFWGYLPADVCSFGVLVLVEIVSGRTNLDTTSEDMTHHFDHYQSDKLLQLLDKRADNADDKQSYKHPSDSITASSNVQSCGDAHRQRGGEGESSLLPGCFSVMEMVPRMRELLSKDRESRES
ncbi:hypothetical protein SELMODRAFT_430849 [Selaginella moellendorffii]|uniref:Uncharacterized protein n=1 Tax=Selaginella moellendorffii TaxID=88036 RepID=D8TAQ4_SELML|nr:hypothetical protein SELMODRAFT_430849 [Selaginella moellendorffii]